MTTHNVGQVSGIYIGSTKPTNTTLIWYDTAIRKHKFYDPTTKSWATIAPQTVTALNYASLKNEAKSGLSVGDYYKITDSSYGNVLAIAVSTTKVLYPNYTGNGLIIDDLTGQKHYISAAEDVTINGSGGTVASSGKLTFTITEVTTLVTGDKLVIERNGKLNKVGIAALVSTAANNLLKFVTGKGLMVDIATWFNGVKDKTGGVVSLEKYNKEINTLRNSINSISGTISSQYNLAVAHTDEEITDAKVYAKEMPEDVATTDTQRTMPGKMTKGAKLSLLIQRIQQWFDYLRWARNIEMYKDFSFNNSGEINNSDNVQSAIEKLVYKLNKKTTAIMQLSDDWAPYGEEKENTKTIQNHKDIEVVAKDTIDTAFAKAVKQLHLLGVIGDPRDNDLPKQGYLHSKTKGYGATDAIPFYTYELCAEDGNINLYNDAQASGDVPQSISLSAKSGILLSGASAQQVFLKGNRINISANWPYDGAIKLIQNNSSGSGLYVSQSNNVEGTYGIETPTIKIGSLTFENNLRTDATYTYYVRADDTFICADGTGEQNIYLPNCDRIGEARVVLIANGNGGKLTIHSQGQNRIDKKGKSDTAVSFQNRGVVYMFVWQYGLYYAKENQNGVSCNGLWQVAKLEATF